MVRLDAEELSRPHDVAVAILNATNCMDVLDPTPGRWTKVWIGDSVRKEDGGWRTVRGLKCKLLDDADREVPPIELDESVCNALTVYQYLRGFSKAEAGESDESQASR